MPPSPERPEADQRPRNSQSACDSLQLEQVARELASLGAETHAQRRVKRIAPWVISLAVHITVVCMALLITWTIIAPPPKDESVLIVADFNALNYEPLARLDGETNTEAEGSRSAGELQEDRAATPSLESTIRDRLAEADVSPAALLGSGFAPSAAGDAGQFAPKPTHNAALFAGLSSSNARKVVYVIDASGSMVATLQVVVDELARSLAKLSPQQRYAVIFFQGTRAIEAPPAGELTSATDDARRRTLDWIKRNVVPSGGTNPLVAIEKALKLKPDAIFLLSQDITGVGQYEVDQRDLLQLLDKLNPVNSATGRRSTQINCIQFLDPDPLDTMKKIAEAHGGANGYKFLTRRELGLEK